MKRPGLNNQVDTQGLLAAIFSIEQPQTEGGMSMKGNVRPNDRQRCPVCNERFVKDGMNWVCLEHRTYPTRFYVEMYWPGHGRVRIFSDRTGTPLDTFERANRLLEALRLEIDEHRFDPSRYMRREQRLFEFKSLAQEWLSKYEKRLRIGEIAPSHFRHVKSYINKKFIAYFGNLDIREIRTKDISDFKNSLDEKLSLKTLKNIMSSLHAIFSQWFDEELIEKLPRFPRIRVPDPGWTWLGEEDQARVLEKVPAADLGMMAFILYQGVRPSEARALQWRDLDFANNLVIIRRTWSQNELRPPKGKKARLLPLDSEVRGLLEKMPKCLDPEAFVFTRNGRHYSEGYCRTLWNRICGELGIHGVSFYAGSRHSLSSQFISDGGSIHDLQQFLGHVDIRTTLRYSHSDLRSKQRVINRRAKVLNFVKKKT